MHAKAEVSQDETFVYLKLTGLVGKCNPQLVHPKKFMGPFLSIVTFKATPTYGTSGLAIGSHWPFPPQGLGEVQEVGPSEMAGAQVAKKDSIARGFPGIHVEGSQDNIKYGARYGAFSALYEGSMHRWGGPRGLKRNTYIPPRNEVRYKKWRSLTYDTTKYAGFGHSSISHTSKWRKADNVRVIGISIQMEGRVNFLVADRKLFDKPYVYTWKDISTATKDFKYQVVSS